MPARGPDEQSRCFDVVYIAGHGNPEVLSDGEHSEFWDWVGEDVCALADCLGGSALLFCAACYGGRELVANGLFAGCDALKFVCGPDRPITPQQGLVAFHRIYHALTEEGAGPIAAVKALKDDFGQVQFICHDRMDWTRAAT